jgi:hypothetical protein
MKYLSKIFIYPILNFLFIQLIQFLKLLKISLKLKEIESLSAENKIMIDTINNELQEEINKEIQDDEAIKNKLKESKNVGI